MAHPDCYHAIVYGHDRTTSTGFSHDLLSFNKEAHIIDGACGGAEHMAIG